MKILVFEPAKGGHHLVYLRYVVEDLISAGHSVFLAAERGATPSEPLRRALGQLLTKCAWVPLTNGMGRLLHGKRLDALNRAQEEVGADRVFLNCFDQISSSLFRRSALGLSPPSALKGKIVGIFVRPRIADNRLPTSMADRWKFSGLCRLVQAKWFRRLLVLDETLPASLKPNLDPALFHILPDPWSGSFGLAPEDARRTLGLPLNKFIFLHYGTSSRRKGLTTVLNAAASLDPAHYALVLAGPFDPEDKNDALLKSLVSEGRAFLFDRYVWSDEEPLFFCACDVVMLAYQGHYGSSNIQSRAAAAHRPVVASDEGLVGTRVRSHHLGLTFPTGDATALAEAIRKVRSQPADVVAPGMDRYAMMHSRESFRNALLASFV